jgi:hypothetical protein
MTKEKKYGIWWKTRQGNEEGGWVLDDAYSVALYANERDAKKDLRGFVHPEQYETRPYARSSGSRARPG